MLVNGRIRCVDKDYLAKLFEDNYSEDILKEFSANNYRGEILRRDFEVPIITDNIKISEDMKYIIYGKKAILSNDVVKISLERL